MRACPGAYVRGPLISPRIVRVRRSRAGLTTTEHQGDQGAGRADPTVMVAIQGDAKSGRGFVGVGRIEGFRLSAEVVEQDRLEPSHEIQLPADLPIRLAEDLVACTADDGGEQPIHGHEGVAASNGGAGGRSDPRARTLASTAIRT